MTGKPITIEMKVSDQPTFEGTLTFIRDFNQLYPCIRPGHYKMDYGKCAICDSSLHSGRFPLDFPDDWKFCCNCLYIAELMIGGDQRICIVPAKIDKIYNKITLVK